MRKYNLDNPILNVDSYKFSHFEQYPPQITHINSYIESRGGKFGSTLFFGLQAFIKQYLLKPITIIDIEEAEAFAKDHGVPFNKAGWMHILQKHDGYLPIKIQAVKEGSVIRNKNVLVQVINTDPNLPWLTSYIETALLRAVWYPVTVATTSWSIKQVIKKFAEETSDEPNNLGFKLNDFGGRGVSSKESAGIGGAAHLVNFSGSDTGTGIAFANLYYDCPMAGFSIPAAEHSTITSWGMDAEEKAYQNMLDKFAKPGALVAVVSDSYDIYHAVKNIWGGTLKQKVIDSGACVIVRPDSGDPVAMSLKVVEMLWEAFGGTINSKGYKVLASCVRVIYGDGINEQSIYDILQNLKRAGFSSDNINFGMGGDLLQNVTRDTNKFAMKASAAIHWDGQCIDVFKDPITDPGKASKKGILALIKDENGYQTIRESELNGRQNYLEVVYLDGKLVREQTFEEIRQLSNT